MTNHDIYTLAPLLIVAFAGSFVLIMWGGEMPYIRDLHGVAIPLILAPLAIVVLFASVYLAAVGGRVATSRMSSVLAGLPLIVILLTTAALVYVNVAR